MSKTFKPGDEAPASAQYEIVGKRGGHTGIERTVSKGKTLPPTPEPDQSYRIADRTKNQSGRNSK